MSRGTSSSRTLFLVLVAVFGLGCKDEPRQKAVSRPEGKRPSASPQQAKLDRTREELLILDAALSKLEKEIEAAQKGGDFETVAKLREKEKALRMTIENTRGDLRVMEALKKDTHRSDAAP